jgi:PAS domain S-box-containing protein
MKATEKKIPAAGPLKSLRFRAEALLEKSPHTGSRASLEDAQDLVHDLQVHQVELEMQNEELCRTQLELTQARDRFSDLYDLAPVGYLTIDSQGTILEANFTVARMLGVPRNKMVAKCLSQFIERNSQNTYYLHRRAVFSSNKPQTCELALRTADGIGLPVHLESLPVAGDAARIRQCRIALVDIAALKRTEAALREACDTLEEKVRLRTVELDTVNAQLEQLLTSSPAIIYSCKASGDHAATFVSKNVREQLGYDAHEFLEDSGFRAARIHPEDKPMVYARLAGLSKEIRHSLEYRFRHNDGTYRWMRDDLNLVKNRAGKPEEIVGCWMDITRQKWAEAASRQSGQALTAFFAEAPLGLLWVAPDGRIVRANQALGTMLGRDDENLFGRRLTEFCADPEVVTNMLERLEGKESLHDNRLRLQRKNRSLLHVLIDANGLREEGKLVHSHWFVRDVTQRVELEKEILAISDRERLRIGQDLHDDLCQQLTSIEYLNRSLERRLQANSKAEAAQATEIGQLTRQAITHARELAHGMFPVELHKESVTGALRDLASRTKKLFQIDCRFQGQSSMPIPDHAAQIHLYRIAQEALRNAVKHGRAGKVTIDLKTSEKKIVLSVRDNGVGIPLKPRKSKGLGLRIMDHRAKLLGGSVLLRKSPKGGTTVICTIPEPPSKHPN